MNIKKYLIVIFISCLVTSVSFGAASVSNSDETTNEPKGPKKTSNYNLALKTIKRANKYDKKGKKVKAEKNYKKALKFLLKANKEKPSEANTLNYLGYTNRKLGNFENAEIYYLLGLEVEPNHIGINEYLGELYVNTNRIDKAKERLKVLENCNCEEFEELSNAIKSGSSKY